MGYKKYDRATANFFKGINTAAKIANRAYKAQQRENQRRERAVQSYLAKCEREAAAAERRRVREAERYAREQARLAKENEKLQKQMQFEAEVQSIIEENEAWTTIHKGVSALVSDNDLIQAISDAEFEKNEVMYEGLFEDPIPDKSLYEQQAKHEADTKFQTDSISKGIESKMGSLGLLSFNDAEPTEESVTAELTAEAKSLIKAFWPWTKKRLVNEYVQERISATLKDKHNNWSTAKQEYESNVFSLQEEIKNLENELQVETGKKTEFISCRTEELYNVDFTSWKSKRDQFYDDYLANLHGLLNGEQAFIDNAFSDTLSDNDLPMEYYVESMYDETTGIVRLDVDLPEIEDVPQQKIVITSTGKQSIRSKGVKDLNDDYVQCICGLAIFLAEDIFNISPKIKNVEISGFTQRPDSKTSLITDQYVYVINFDRDTFNKINFENFSAIQIFSFFKHHINATKTMVLKEIDLNNAYDKLQQYEPVDYDEFILQNPDYAQKKVSKSKSTSTSTKSQSSGSAPQLSPFAKATIISDKFYSFVSKLDTKDIMAHTDSLRGVNINFVGNPFKGPDCDLTQYRGKLFFICIVDLYKSLKQMGVDVFKTQDSLFAYSLLFNKIYTQWPADYPNISTIQSAAQSFNTSFYKAMDAIPNVPHKFLIMELMCDYKDLSYYRQYIGLLKEFAEFVEENSASNAIKNAVRSYLSQLNEYSL